jgi:hypothetical protein
MLLECTAGYLILLGYLHYFHAQVAHWVISEFYRWMICSSMVHSAQCLMLLMMLHLSCWFILDATVWLILLHNLFWSTLHAKQCYMLLHSSVIDAWPCCCWTMPDAFAYFILLHHICCSVLDAIPTLMLLNAWCFSMLHATKCFTLLPALLYAMLDVAPCFRLLRYLCCCMLDADRCFMLFHAWCCSIHGPLCCSTIICWSVFYFTPCCMQIRALCLFILDTARALCCSILNVSPCFILFHV